MDITEIFDKQTMEAITADAKSAGISAEDVEKVLGSLTDQNLAPTRSVNSAPELMSLLDDDQDAVVADVADATGVDRMKTSTILMLAAPFLLKYLFSSGSAQQQSSSGLSTALLSALLGGGMQHQTSSGMGSLLGSLLGGGMQAQPQQTDLLSSLLGSSVQQTQQSNSLFGSLLGGAPQQPAYSGNSTTALLNSLLGGGMQAQPQQSYVSQNGAGMGDLLNLLGGPAQSTQQPVQQQSAQGGGLLNALFNILGDNG